MPPPPLAPPQEPRALAGARTDRALIQYVDPVSFIKNAMVLVVLSALVSLGLSYLLGLIPGGGAAMMPASLGRLRVLGPAIAVVAAVLGVCVSVYVFNLVARWTNGLPIRFREPAGWRSGSLELTGVAPLSALKAGAVYGALSGLLATLCGFGALGTVLRGASAGLGGSVPGGLAGPAWLLAMPLMRAAETAIVWWLGSLVYRWLAGVWGGIRFETVAGN